MQTASHICKNCNQSFTGKYCNHCGEKVYSEKDKSVWHFFEEGLHFITHFEGTFFNTLKKIFTRPGQLSVDYCNGKRKTYFKPLSLFLLLVVLYLLFPFFEGLNMKLYYHTHQAFYGKYAMQKATAVMSETKWTDQQLTAAFHQKSEKVSKFLLLILLPLTALFFWALTYRKRKYFFDQMVFSAEINCMYLLWGFLLLPLLLFAAQKISYLTTRSYFNIEDWKLGLITYLVLCTYTGIGAWRFYKLNGWQSFGFALLFYIAHIIIVQYIYKFILFFIVIHQIH
ncbi:MAG TPA: DUF3667 domain-containing protein [Chitinophagaceae bacterium]|nr:DUF3667 domain-containing protein [Chitinophagaceae bacterium]